MFMGGFLREQCPDKFIIAEQPAAYSSRSPELFDRPEMAGPKINAFLTHLAVNEKVSASMQNRALAALLFLYRHFVGREVGDLGHVIRARKPTRLPVVMTREEVKSVLMMPCSLASYPALNVVLRVLYGYI